MLENASAHLAQNVIELRKKRNWSQSHLSEYSKIPRSTITYVESGAGNPSLAILVKIADALNVGVDELLSQPRSTTELYTPSDFEIQKRGSKATIHKILPDRIQGIEIDKITMPERSSFGGNLHLQGTKEYLYLIEGEITMMIAGETYVVPAGHLLAFQGDQPHAYRSTGSSTAVAMSIVIPMSKFLGRDANELI